VTAPAWARTPWPEGSAWRGAVAGLLVAQLVTRLCAAVRIWRPVKSPLSAPADRLRSLPVPERSPSGAEGGRRVGGALRPVFGPP
jgi:hypothetical protein